jgi:hypothetical protein
MHTTNSCRSFGLTQALSEGVVAFSALGASAAVFHSSSLWVCGVFWRLLCMEHV